MRIIAQGEISDRIRAAGNAYYPGYVVMGSEAAVMIDCGINLMGPLYMKSLGELLGDPNRLRYLFVTHSHYDHLGSMPYLKSKIPGLVLGGNPRIESLLEKESVRVQMNHLSEIQRPQFGAIAGNEDVSLVPVKIDMPFTGGERVPLGDLTVEVIAVPGHTRDSLAYYVPEIGALFAGEAAGVPEGKSSTAIQVEFLSSYEDYCASLEKMSSLNPSLIAIGHGCVITGSDARSFLDQSIRETGEYRALIERYLHDTGGNITRAIDAMVLHEYDTRGTILQERNAYITNLTAQVKLIASLGKG